MAALEPGDELEARHDIAQTIAGPRTTAAAAASTAARD
jgi:hypothetical protein